MLVSLKLEFAVGSYCPWKFNLYYRYSTHSVHIECPVLRVYECQVNTWRLSHIPLGSNLIPRPAWLSKSWVWPGNEDIVPLKDSHIRLIHTHKASSWAPNKFSCSSFVICNIIAASHKDWVNKAVSHSRCKFAVACTLLPDSCPQSTPSPSQHG